MLKGATIFVPLEGVVDFNQEIERLDKELVKLRKDLGGILKKLGNSGFLTKAPPDIVDKVRAKKRELLEKQEKLENNLHRIRGIHDSRQ